MTARLMTLHARKSSRDNAVAAAVEWSIRPLALHISSTNASDKRIYLTFECNIHVERDSMSNYPRGQAG